MKANAESHDFQAEVSRLMDIIINSLYGNKDIFLRELLSNAGDAVEKARFNSISDPKYLGEKQELIDNLGTVAKSGTTNFLEALKDGAEQDASRLIGQFGVGFYSAFLVADQVIFTSVSGDEPDKQHVWQSGADGSFTLAEDPRGNTLGRGSRVTLVLKEEATEYLKPEKIKEIANKYSQFMLHPLYMKKTEAEMAKDDDDDEELDDDEEEKEEKKPDEAKSRKRRWRRMMTTTRSLTTMRRRRRRRSRTRPSPGSGSTRSSRSGSAPRTTSRRRNTMSSTRPSGRTFSSRSRTPTLTRRATSSSSPFFTSRSAPRRT